MTNNKFKVGIKHLIMYIVISLLINFVICFAILFILERKVRVEKFEDAKIYEKSTVELGRELMGREFATVVADINYLKNVYKDGFLDENIYNKLGDNWTEFSVQHRIYDQMRFINANGDEVIRINYSDEEATLVLKEGLQNKADRYYFYDSINLPEGSIYVSPLDLNIEQGEIEIPYKPMVRFSAPVYTDEGELIGVVVLNYLAQQMLDEFGEISGHSTGNMILLNSEGYWLSSPDDSQLWNFMFQEKSDETFAKYYLDEWKEILVDSGQIITDNGLFTFSVADLESKIGNNTTLASKDIYIGGGDWYIVSFALRTDSKRILFYDHIGDLLKDIIAENVLFAIFLIMISIAAGVLIFLYMRAYRKTKFFSRYDVLTNVYNRRAGTDKLDDMLLAKERKNFLLSLCFVDVNGLKQVNDILGHKHGDELLKTVTGVIKDQIRESDFIARMGGDEFLVVFPRIDGESAENVWKRIVKQFDMINEQEDRHYLISVSHGIVFCGGEKSCTTTDNMIKAADEKMYDEKRFIKKSFYAIRDAKRK